MRTKPITLPTWLRRTALTLVFVMGLNSLAPMSFGSMIVSQASSAEDLRSADMAAMQQMLELKVVQHRLGELGFTQDEIQSRMDLASDADLHQLAVQSNALAAGGDIGLIAVLVVIVLVLVILKLTANDTGIQTDILAA